MAESSINSSKQQSPQTTSHDQRGQQDESETRYQRIMAELPVDKGWSPADQGSHLYQYQDFWYIRMFLKGLLALQDNFSAASSSDIIVSSSLKTGTTWLKALTFAICTRKQFLPSPAENPLLTSMPHDLIPFLEVDLAKQGTNKDRRDHNNLPLLATHIPYSSLPPSIIDSGCKFIYIWRDPKDVFISLWHFTRKILMKWYEGVEPISLEKAFDLFCQGKSLYGPYWEHVLGYWNASLDRPDKILFLKYEDMMMDPAPYVRRLGEFVGLPFSEEEEETEGEIDRIIRLCSFDSLSNLEVNKSGMHRPESPSTTMENSMYFRKAKVGDWKNYLTTGMAEKIDMITVQKLGGSGLKL